MLKLSASLLCVLICLPAGCKRKGPGSSSSRNGRAPSPEAEELAGAWETAKEFAKAWEKKDYAAARSLCSAELIDRLGEQKLRERITGMPNHVHKLQSVTSPRRIGEGRLEFTMDVKILMTGDMDRRERSVAWKVVLVQRDSRWLVEKIPEE